jgi:hypothetical protein
MNTAKIGMELNQTPDNVTVLNIEAELKKQKEIAENEISLAITVKERETEEPFQEKLKYPKENENKIN